MQPILTIFVAFTRRWALDTWLANLAAVEHDPARTNLCLIVDIDEPIIEREFAAFVEKHKYRSFHMKINEDWSPNEVKLAIRRMRVADIKNQSKDLIAKTDGDIIISLEDDTVFDRLKNFSQLYQPLLDNPRIGYVTGVQMGRWGAKILGVWNCDQVVNPEKIWTMLPPGETSSVGRNQQITAGGFYGYSTRRELYLAHEYYTSSAQPWGPDVNFGFWVRQNFFFCVVDWGLLFGHNDHNIIAYPDDPQHAKELVSASWEKSELNGKWERTDHEHDRF